MILTDANLDAFIESRQWRCTVEEVQEAAARLLKEKRALGIGGGPDVFTASDLAPPPIPMRLLCERCGELHVDEGEFATKPHHTHACQTCGAVWRPAIVATVGVRFLPGFKNETPPRDELPTARSNIDADPRLERRCPTCKAPFWVLDRRWGIRAVRCACQPAPLP